MKAFEGCATEIARPSGPAKKNQPSLWMGFYIECDQSSPHTLRLREPVPPSFLQKLMPVPQTYQFSPLKDKKIVTFIEKDV